MTKRSESERSRIIRQCVEIERKNGDVIAYLMSEHYISPQATWYNIQRCDLNRAEGFITDGHPDPKRRKLNNTLNSRNLEFAERRDEHAAEAAKAAIRGESPIQYLKSVGYKSPDSVWSKMRKEILPWKYPELSSMIPKRIIYKANDHGNPSARTDSDVLCIIRK